VGPCKNAPRGGTTARVVELLGRSHSALTAKQIGCRLGLHRQTVHGVLGSLLRQGRVTRARDYGQAHWPYVWRGVPSGCAA